VSRVTYPIDWRRELEKLGPYLDGTGGVIRISYNGDQYAPREFREVLKTRYERQSDNQTWRSIRIYREWHTTRFLGEILSEFERKLAGFNSYLEQEAQDEVSNAKKVLSDNEFNGDAKLSLENVNIYFGGTPKTRDRDKHVERVCADLRRFLESGGHMMVVLIHASAREQSEFWTFLWDRGLKPLVEHGLFFIYMVDLSDETRGDHDCIPIPAVEINLPCRLDDEREDDAYNDLVEVLLKEVSGLPADAARAAADAHINSHWENIKDFHDRLPGLILRLGQSVNKEMRR